MDIKTLISKVKENKDLREAIVFCFSTLVTLGFAISNRVLGAVNKSIWHETIGLYYLLLLAIKIIIILTQKDNKKRTFEKIEKNNKIIFYITGSILFLVNIALSGPIILMIMDKRIIQTYFSS